MHEPAVRPRRWGIGNDSHWDDDSSRRLIQDGLEVGVYLDCHVMTDIESIGRQVGMGQK